MHAESLFVGGNVAGLLFSIFLSAPAYSPSDRHAHTHTHAWTIKKTDSTKKTDLHKHWAQHQDLAYCETERPGNPIRHLRRQIVAFLYAAHMWQVGPYNTFFYSSSFFSCFPARFLFAILFLYSALFLFYIFLFCSHLKKCDFFPIHIHAFFFF